MRRVSFKDFIPPILVRLFNFIVISYLKKNKGQIKHPFVALPDKLDVRWVMDIGSNVGDVAVAAIKSYPKSKVLCFEPVQETFEVLKNRLFPYKKRTRLYNFAFSDQNKSSIINITSSNGANSIEAQTSFHKKCNPNVKEVSKERITLKKLDSFIGKLPSKKIDIVKIDVEGHELKVLNGGKVFFEHYVDIVLIEISFMRDSSVSKQAIFPIFNFFKKRGFILINITDLHFTEDYLVKIAQFDCVFRHKRYIETS